MCEYPIPFQRMSQEVPFVDSLLNEILSGLKGTCRKGKKSLIVLLWLHSLFFS